jgi:hypothetical protein
MKNENENEIENETFTLWIARDFDGEIFAYKTKPFWKDCQFLSQISEDNDLTEINIMTIQKKYFPSIKPGECRKATVVLDDETPRSEAEESVIEHFSDGAESRI